jgi:hypothetical protein
MLIKTLTLHSLTYIVGMISSIAVHQVIPSSGTRAGLRLDTNTKPSITTHQVVNRLVKSDRLPIKQVKPGAEDEARGHVPGQIALNPRFKIDWKPPIHVLGRCFADAGLNHKVTWSASPPSRPLPTAEPFLSVGSAARSGSWESPDATVACAPTCFICDCVDSFCRDKCMLLTTMLPSEPRSSVV